MVLISDSPWAPASTAGTPASRMSPMLGVSLMSTGMVEYSTAQPATVFSTSGSDPTAEPMPRSHMPCGQPKLSSRPSQPVSIEALMMSRQSSCDSTINETMTACFGNLRLTSRISRRLTSSGRSVMSSMLLKPTMRVPFTSSEPKRLEVSTMGSPSVFHTAPPQPMSKARMTCSPELVGGALASQKGLGLLMPAKSIERSAMDSSLRRRPAGRRDPAAHGPRVTRRRECTTPDEALASRQATATERDTGRGALGGVRARPLELMLFRGVGEGRGRDLSVGDGLCHLVEVDRADEPLVLDC